MTAKPSQIPTLDGLRGLACLLVFFSHAGLAGWFYYMPGTGQFGVMLFYTLSGYLMSYHYLSGTSSAHHWLTFLLRRLFRIFPLLFFILACKWAGYMLHFTGNPSAPDCHGILCWLWTMPLSLSWTIAVEVQFYFLFPIICIGLLFLPRYKITALAILWAGLLLFDPKGSITTLWPYLSFFIGGMLGEYALRYSPQLGLEPVHWNILAVLYTTALFVCVIYYRADLINMVHVKIWQYQLLLSPLMAVTVMSISQATGIVKWVYANHVASFLGRISYSLFLLHSYVFHYGGEVIHTGMYHNIFVALPLSVILAWLSYECIEHPFNKLGKYLLSNINSRSMVRNVERYQT